MKKLSNETRVKFHAHTVDSSSFCFLKKGKKKKKMFKQKTISFYCYGSWCTRDIDYHVYIVSRF